MLERQSDLIKDSTKHRTSIEFPVILIRTLNDRLEMIGEIDGKTPSRQEFIATLIFEALKQGSEANIDLLRQYRRARIADIKRLGITQTQPRFGRPKSNT